MLIGGSADAIPNARALLRSRDLLAVIQDSALFALFLSFSLIVSFEF